MAEIEPVIFDFKARVDGYLADIRRTTTTVDQKIGLQEKRVKSLERTFLQSSTAISGSLRALAGTLAGYFTGRELVGLLDSFTRLQNNLKVAGLEGDNLKRVQDQLFASAQKYGVEVEVLSKLFGTLSQASKELGATQGQVFKLTDAVSASLKIAGISSTEASGALLQLGQALRSPKIQAEEFNSLLDGLYPLLEAAAKGSDRWKGSVAKLTADVKNGKVTSQEFFQAILKGSDSLDQKAAKATLTLAAGVSTLTNAFTMYFGAADKANGVSAALGETLGAIADNLDTLIPAIALVATAIGVRYAVGAAGAAAATVLASDAMFALSARAAGAATSVEALTFAMQGARGALITALILALGAALYYTTDAMTGAQEATGRFAKTQEQTQKASKDAADAIDKLATATGKARDEALKAAEAQRKKAQETLAAARADVLAAEAALHLAKARAQDRLAAAQQAVPLTGDPRGFGAALIQPNADVNQAEANLTAAQKAVTDNLRTLAQLDAKLSAPVSTAAGATPGGKGKGGSKGSGRSATEIAQRHAEELSRLSQEELQAQLALTADADKRAALSYDLLRSEYEQRVAQIQAEKDFTGAQKAAQLAALKKLYGVGGLDKDGNIVVDGNSGLLGQAVEKDRARQLEQEAQQLADARYQSEREQLQQQYDLADSTAERKRLALALVDAEEAHLLKTLDAIKDSQVASAADKQAASIDRERVQLLAGGRREQVRRDNLTPGQDYLRQLNIEAGNLGDAYEGIAVRGIQRINDGLAEATKNALGLHGALGDIVRDFIELAIRQTLLGPLANALFGGGAGGSLLGGLFGGGGKNIANSLTGKRATGGPVGAGGTYLVGESGPELLRMGGQSGFVVPNSRLNMGGGGTVVQQFHFDARGAVMTQDLINQMNAAVAKGAMVTMQLASADAQGKMLSRGRRRIPG